MKREDGKRCKRKAKKDEMECNLGKDGREAGDGPQADDVAVRSPERVAVGPWRGFGWLARSRSPARLFFIAFFFQARSEIAVSSYTMHASSPCDQ